MTAPAIRLGVNVDHVATLRNARGGHHPDPLAAARLALDSGADSITVHLREDRRHIRDADVRAMRAELSAPINLEMAATAEMVAFAREIRPHAACLVPERRAELTTEGGLDAVGQEAALAPVVAALREAGARVSLFLDPEPAQIAAAARLGAGAVELHTGTWCEARGEARAREEARLRHAARLVAEAGIECHAGHGLDYETAAILAAVPEIVELNIGHFLMGQALFDGLGPSIRRMKQAMLDARR
ncbi:pyridoxine 5'-phosphate synthase [Pseudoroseomonas wenyumeiae]|uniref:Pyridoxine 5'-phosphate synthase n=1 Tax=Teichococcus wenyumeiae TaxID=2478470 RepID=A0A3A9JNU1_9PROT|nr:pyridoxine 5'-phosphate synthase [Pseudoroseomonas wenyumeiae]RKK00589.1 pyridoxine 5'-phosphate synthase [Pseudoroseomonas wenyumeiae]RMI25315.1 pyridoxine 5'-phosphate synthase [Pseudoroseomonas wenyumeiae]